MNGNDLYQLSLNHPQIRKLIPEGFFPTLPELQWEGGRSLIHLYYSCRKRVWEDCFCVTLSGRTLRLLRFQRLVSRISSDQSLTPPELPESIMAYYDQCAEALSLKVPHARQKAYLDLVRKRTHLRAAFTTVIFQSRFRYLGINPRGKTSLITDYEKEFES